MKTNTQQLVKIIDFWKKSVEKDELYDRLILEKIDHKSKEIVDLVGPRRSGKSSILKLIIRRLKLSDNFLYINFEDPFFVTHNNPQIIEEMVAVFREYFNPRLDYLFFDEIQEINQWEKAIRKLRDGEKVKIFITGSSSKLLSGEISSLITGRHLSYNISPLSFSEFLVFRKIKIRAKKDIILKERNTLRMFGEYLKIGGFPEAALTADVELLKNYFYDILQKDIVMRHNIREKEVLEKMAVYLLSNSGKITSMESLKAAFNISFFAAQTYLKYFKESFLVFELPQFSYSLKKQSKALKKIYAVDIGLANAVSFKFSEDKGRMLENAVFLELKNKKGELYYYKTKNNLEVDFLVKEKTKVKKLIQVCWTLEDKKTKEREIKSLMVAMDELKLKNGFILTYNEEDEIKVNKKMINIVPCWKWLLKDYCAII